MEFAPIWTERLLIRPMQAEDAVALAERRSDPRVARFQNWVVPFPLELAEDMVSEVMAMRGPTDGEWWMAAIIDQVTDQAIGDVAVHMTWSMRSAEIGYTLDARHWGGGYATEAVGALVEYLFSDPRPTRISATLHPDNVASAMVLERTGFVHEGHTRLSYWVGEVNSDDWIYGLTRAGWEEWRNRPRHRPEVVSLEEIDHRVMRSLEDLRTHKTQERFVAPVLASFADALFPKRVDGHPVEPWMRSVRADGDLVGFVMVAGPARHRAEPYLRRMLIDRLHQRRGIGREVLDLVVAVCRDAAAESLLVSWVEGRGSPAPFYLDYGFVPTGEMKGNETMARLEL